MSSMRDNDDTSFQAFVEALIYLAEHRMPGDHPKIRVNLLPILPSGADLDSARSIDLTPELADLLTGAIYKLDATAQPVEEIASGVWSAAAVAQNDPDLYAGVTDVFDALDVRQITKEVLDDRQVPMVRAVEALDDVFGEVVDPYADEDGDL